MSRPKKLGERAPDLRDTDGAGDWAHPGDEIDRAAVPAAKELLADKQGALELFARLLHACLPGKGYSVRMGRERHWQAGFHRMVATSYLASPELFDGMKPKQVADALGISWWAFRKQLRSVRDTLEAREAAAKGRKGRARPASGA